MMSSINPNILKQINPCPFSKGERLEKWAYNHPTTIKVIAVAGIVLGLGSLVALPFIAPLLNTGVIVTIAITGTLLILASSVTALIVKFLNISPHNMKNHVYKPGQCPGGKLYYEGDVPILCLNTADPLQAGFTQGYLCGEGLHRFVSNFKFTLPSINNLPKTITTLSQNVPRAYLTEMKGVVDGYNQWVKEQPKTRKLTSINLDDLFLLHLIPDFSRCSNIASQNQEKWNAPVLTAACTSIVDQEQGKLTLARNMDWPSFGVMGAFSFVIKRCGQNNISLNTVEVAVPGLVGTITGMNEHGLAISMNVSSGNETPTGTLPALFYNRQCLQSCQNLSEAKQFIQDKKPLGPYHLTVLDENAAQSFHFYQNQTLPTRSFAQGAPLATFNCEYSPQPRFVYSHDSTRQAQFDAFIQARANGTQIPLDTVLSLDHINNSGSIHRIMLQPATRSLKLSFNNSFAGTVPLQTVSAQALLNS